MQPTQPAAAQQWQVYNTRTGQAVCRPNKTLAGARRCRDRLDMQYGAAVHVVRPV